MHIFYAVIVCSLLCLTGCEPSGSSEAMKNLQARIDLVILLGEINQRAVLTRTDVDCVNLLVDRAIVDEPTRQQLLAKCRELTADRKSKQAIDKVTREMGQLVPLPEKYAKAYRF